MYYKVRLAMYKLYLISYFDSQNRPDFICTTNLGSRVYKLYLVSYFEPQNLPDFTCTRNLGSRCVRKKVLSYRIHCDDVMHRDFFSRLEGRILFLRYCANVGWPKCNMFQEKIVAFVFYPTVERLHRKAVSLRKAKST